MVLGALSADPCSKEEFSRLEQEARELSQEKALEIYWTLYRCDPDNTDILFYLGRILSQRGEWEEAEKLLKRCLAIAPQYSDAAIQLANLYRWEGRFSESNAIYRQYPNNKDAREGLVLNLMAQRKYGEAKKEYAVIIRDEPNEWVNWVRLFDVRSHTDPSAFLSMGYAESKENDPTVHAPVVKTYYTSITPKLFFPVGDLVKFDIRGIIFKQKENEIYPPFGTNYSAVIGGGELVSHYCFAKGWRWDFVLRGIGAWSIQDNTTFPFQSTSRFEPGTAIIYNQGAHLAVLDLHIESFIIKNFSSGISKLLQLDEGEAIYLFRPDVRYHPEGEVWINETFYQDNLHNIRSTQGFEFKFSPFRTFNCITVGYWFEHIHFKDLSPNYFSYKNQLCNMFEVRFYQEFLRGLSLEILYEGGFQNTYTLLQPIGTFIFAANRQDLRENRVTAKLFYQWKDHLRLQVGGYYFKNTLPYRALNINASMLWQF